MLLRCGPSLARPTGEGLSRKLLRLSVQQPVSASTAPLPCAVLNNPGNSVRFPREHSVRKNGTAKREVTDRKDCMS